MRVLGCCSDSKQAKKLFSSSCQCTVSTGGSEAAAPKVGDGLNALPHLLGVVGVEVALNIFPVDVPAQVGSCGSVCQAVPSSVGYVLGSDHSLYIAGHPGLLIWEKQMHLFTVTVSAELNVK